MNDETGLGYTIVVRKDDGTEHDVTEGVRALYDHTVTSMDWGSGFFSLEDAREVITVAVACGFLVPDHAIAEFEGYAREVGYGTCADCGQPCFYSHPSRREPQSGWLHGQGARTGHLRTGVLVAVEADHPVRLWRTTE